MFEDIAKQLGRGTAKEMLKDIAEEKPVMDIIEGFIVDCPLEITGTVGQAVEIDQQHSFVVHLCSLPPCIGLLGRLSAPRPF